MTARFILTCDDDVWPDFLGFTNAIAAIKEGQLLDAVEARICAVEIAGLKSVGTSGIPDMTGAHTLDAAVMTGNNRLFASVAALEGYAHPFKVARKMLEMQKSEEFVYNMLCGTGASVFAKSIGADKASKPHNAMNHEETQHDTVGCIAFDGKNFAVGTSTSGWGNKYPGRVGDAPIPGAGFYATNLGAAFCTWSGETSNRILPSVKVMHALELGLPLDKAVEFALQSCSEIKDGYIAPIVVFATTKEEFAIAAHGFESKKVPATYSFWKEGMNAPERRPVQEWHKGTNVLIVKP